MSNITKTAMITVCGRPNVGKSSLTNALVGEKVAIVSNKAQTTRNRIYGIVNREDTQYILLDTPGLHKPKSALGDYMVKVVTSSLSDVDCALLLVEPIPHVGGPEQALIDRNHFVCALFINAGYDRSVFFACKGGIDFIPVMIRIFHANHAFDRDDALQSLLQELLFFRELLFVGEVQICASAAFFLIRTFRR